MMDSLDMFVRYGYFSSGGCDVETACCAARHAPDMRSSILSSRDYRFDHITCLETEMLLLA
jgi:hypothetical protein